MKIQKKLLISILPLSLGLSFVQGACVFWYLTHPPSQLSQLHASVENDTALQLALFSSLATFSVVLVILFVVQLNISRLIIQRVNKVKDMVKHIGDEDTSGDNDIYSSNNDEIGAIYQSLEEMKQNLDISHKSMHKLAYFDKLTGLPNRTLLQQELNSSLAGAKRRNEHFAIIFLDLDNFKEVNDTLGHEFGDILLVEVSQRIKHYLRGSDYIIRENLSDPESGKSVLARLAGDEFTLLLNDLHNPNAASKVARRILDGLDQPFVLNNHEVQVGVSMGIAVYPQDGETPETLLKHADMAMFEAKNGGKNNFEFFTKEMSSIASLPWKITFAKH